MQRHAALLVEGFHEGRLRLLKLFPVIYCRFRWDLIFIWKIFQGDMEPEVQAMFPLRDCSETCGHRLALRIMEYVSIPLVYRLSRWNSLPSDVVEENDETSFKRRLDEHLLRRGQATDV